MHSSLIHAVIGNSFYLKRVDQDFGRSVPAVSKLFVDSWTMLTFLKENVMPDLCSTITKTLRPEMLIKIGV